MSNNSSSQTLRRWRRRAWMAAVLPAAFLCAGVSAQGQTAKPTPSDLNRVVAGVAAPDFTLPDAQGKPHKLSAFRGTPTVLVFYRGYW